MFTADAEKRMAHRRGCPFRGGCACKVSGKTAGKNFKKEVTVMKKLFSVIMAFVMVAAMAGCGQSTAAADKNVGAVGEVSAEVLEMLGMSEEEFAAMDPEKQQAILYEMGAVMGEQSQQSQQPQQPQTPAKSHTPDDVMAGGKYKVVMGDYMNSITLYYEDGKLVRIEEEFQKNSEEEAESYTYEGDALADYGFNFIDWDGASLQEILDGMKDYGGFGQYEIVAE